MIKSKKQMYVVVGAFALILMMFTTTYAFFNYTRTGSSNNIKVGRISFVSRQTNTITLNNLFPIDPSEQNIMNDETKVGTLVIEIEGDTDYSGGVEYVLSSVDSNNVVNNKIIPISLDFTITGLGNESSSYWTARDLKNATIYKKIVGDTLDGDQMLLVGYIKKNTTSGQVEGIDGSITIKAYLDKNKILISDTYDGTESDNMGTSNSMAEEMTVLTTSEWNTFQTNGISFKVKVEANEGIWVEQGTPSRCFTTSSVERKYLRNSNMNVNSCVSVLEELIGPEEEGNTVDVGETYQAFCNGTGTIWDKSFQEMLDSNNGFNQNALNTLEDSEIIVPVYSTTITDYDENCGRNVYIPSVINTTYSIGEIINPNMNINTCVSTLNEMWGESDQYEFLCSGQQAWGDSFQIDLNDDGSFSEEELATLESNGIILKDTNNNDRYILNPNMNINTCVSILNEMWGEDDQYEPYCKGQQAWGSSLQGYYDNDIFTQSELEILKSNSIIVPNSINVSANVIDIRGLTSKNILVATVSNEIYNNGSVCIGKFKDGVKVKNESNTSSCEVSFCPGCKFIYTETPFYAVWNIVNADPTVLTSGYSDNYQDVIASSGKDYFLGVKLNNQNQITNAYACAIKKGLKNNGAPFCLEGSPDGSTRNNNLKILQSIFEPNFTFDGQTYGCNEELASCNDEEGTYGGDISYSMPAASDIRVGIGNGVCYVYYNGALNCGVSD